MEPDLFDIERKALSDARRALETQEADGHRLALAALTGDYERVIREMRRLISHADRTERELNRANQRLTELTQTLDYRSRHDGLTGLLNRETLIAQAETLLTAQALGLIIVDIDHFKQVNDRYGHPIGDRILIEVGAALLAHAPVHGGLCGRLGGEEFAVIIPAATPIALMQCATGAAVAIRNLRHDRHPGLRVTASFGVALAEPGACFDRLYICADDALYRAKHAGRDRIELVADCVGAD